MLIAHHRPLNVPILLMAALASCGGTASTATGEPPPNVLLIIADDLSADLGCYGNQLVATPHVDRLAQRGVRFERAYCQYPLCNPARASLLTGLRPDTCGVRDNGTHFRTAAPTIATLPEHFRRHGYYTAAVGKVFHDGVPKGTTGFDDPRSWDVSICPHGVEPEMVDQIHSLVPGQVGGTVSWLAVPGDGENLTDAIRARAAIELLEQHGQRPFFLTVGFYRPHTPYVAPQSYFDPVSIDRIALPEGPFEDREDIPLAALPDKPDQLTMTDPQRRQAIQAYYASVGFVDAQVGRLLAALDRLQLAERTIVVFVSDHGYHLGEHGLWQKRSAFEESARVPLVIWAPGRVAAGKSCPRPVELVDLYPTLAELCGLPLPDHLQGQSLCPLLVDPQAPFRSEALTQVNCATASLADKQAPRGYSIRTERYRYTEWDAGREGAELYDHQLDPREQTNRIGDPAYRSVLAELRSRLADRVAQAGGPTDAARRVTRTADEPLRIVALGDSITRGARAGVLPEETFAQLIQRGLADSGQPVEVINAGIGGQRTDQALERLQRDVIALRPHLVTIMYGTNDSFVDPGRTDSRLSLGRYRNNLHKLVEQLLAADIVPVLMTPPAFGDEHRRNGLGEDANLRLARYAAACRQVARETGTHLVDHFDYWSRQNSAGLNIQVWTTDGCHPNPLGHRQIAQRMLPILHPALWE